MLACGRMNDAGRGPPLLTESSGLTLLLGSRGHARMRERFFRQTYILSSWQNPHSARGVAGLKRPPVVPLARGVRIFPNAPDWCQGAVPLVCGVLRQRAPNVLCVAGHAENLPGAGLE